MPFLTEAQVLTVESNVEALAEAVRRDKAATNDNLEATRRSTALAIEARNAAEAAAGGVAANTEAAETAAAAAAQALADIDVAVTGAAEGGAWVIDTAYDEGDWVVYRNNGYSARRDNIGQRPSETGNTADWRLMVRGSASDEIWLSAYDPDTTGATSFCAVFETAAEDADELKRTLRVGAGTYLQDRDIDIVGYTNLTIIFDPGVVILNPGRSRLKNDGVTSFILPWAFEFRDCPGLRVLGWPTFKTVGASGGSSSGAFNSTNYTLRRPVIGLVDCDGWHLQIRHEGGNGLGFFDADRDAIISDLNLDLTAVEFAYFGTRTAFFCAYNSPNGLHDRCELVPDTCSREQFTFLGSHNCRSVRPRSVSEGQNFASLGKSILCDNFQLIDPQVRDTSIGSLWDIVGNDFLFQGGSLIEYPNGKICDLSHEWTGSNGPIARAVFRDIRSTGTGVVNAAGDSTTEEIEDNPITDVLIENCRFNIGLEDFSSTHSANIPRVVSARFSKMAYVNESPVGYTWTNDGGQLIEVLDSSLTWTLPSASIGTNSRSMVAKVLNRYVNCHFRANSSLAGSGAGLASLPFSGSNVGGVHEFRGGSIKDTTIAITGGAVLRLYGVELVDFAYTVTDGSIAFFDCTIDGVPTDKLAAETQAATAQFTTPGLRRLTLLLDDYIRELKEIGAWSLIDSTGVLVTDAADQYLVNIKAPTLYRPAAVNTVNWTKLAGVAGDGVSGYVDLNFGPTTSGINFAQNSAYASVWSGGANLAETAYILGTTGAGITFINPRHGSDQFQARINDASATTQACTDSRGHFAIWRTAADARAWSINGAATGNDTTASTTPSSGDFTLWRRNTQYSTRTGYLWMIGGGGLGAMNADLYAIQRRYLIALGLSV